MDGEQAVLLTQSEKALVLSRTDQQLIAIVKNTKGESYSDEVIQAAKQQLVQKGYDLENL